MPDPVEPAPRLLRRLMAERGYTQRALAARTRERGQGPGVARGTIGNLLSGADPATAGVLEQLADALEVDPEVFVEYRLARARESLDERVVGLERAVANLRAIRSQGAGDAASESLIADVPARLDRETRSAPRASSGRRQPSRPAAGRQRSA